MATYEISMDTSYQQREWGISEALRELIANAIDSEKRGESDLHIKYLPRSKTLVVESRGTMLPMSSLLMGTSEARGREDNIGTFGEGLVMSLKTLALLIRQGSLTSVKVTNASESWTPFIEWSDTWSTEILKIRTRTLKKPTDNFSVKVTPVEPEGWEIIQSWFLKLDPSYDEKQTVRVDNSSILLDKAYQGKLFVKGVYVKHRDNLRYGYNLDMKLNRDRKLMDEWDLRWTLQGLLGIAFGQYPKKFSSLIDEMVDSGDYLEFDSASNFRYYDQVIDAVVDNFEGKHGKDAIPVKNMTEARELDVLGKTAIVVSGTVKDLIEERRGSLESRKAAAQYSSTKTYSWRDLSTTEQDNIIRCTDLVNAAGIVRGGESILDMLKVVDFADESMLGRYDRKRTEIMLAKRISSDFKETLKTLVHEICHRDKEADDGTELHHELQHQAWADIVTFLVSAYE